MNAQRFNYYCDSTHFEHKALSRSSEVVLTTLLLEKIELLERLQSVDGKGKITIAGHTETLHGILELNVVEDDGRDVVFVLLGEGLIWTRFDLGEELLGVVLDGSGDLGAEFSSVVVSLGLGEGDSERHILVDLLEIGLHGGEESGLWVLLNLGGLRSGSFVSGDVFLSDGVWSNIWEGSNELVVRWVVLVSSKGRDGCGISGGDESGNSKSISQEFHYLIN